MTREAQQASGSNALVTRFDDIAGIDRSKLEVRGIQPFLTWVPRVPVIQGLQLKISDLRSQIAGASAIRVFCRHPVSATFDGSHLSPWQVKEVARHSATMVQCNITVAATPWVVRDEPPSVKDLKFGPLGLNFGFEVHNTPLKALRGHV